MRNKSHTRSYRRVLAVCARDNDGVKSQGHSDLANGAYNERAPLVCCEERRDKCEKSDKEKREGDKPEEADSVNAKIGKGFLQVYLCNGHTRKYHQLSQRSFCIAIMAMQDLILGSFLPSFFSKKRKSRSDKSKIETGKLAVQFEFIAIFLC
jgi:hypothetical protein